MSRGHLARAQEKRVQKERQIRANLQETKEFFREQKLYDSQSRSIERGHARSIVREEAQREYQIREEEAARQLAAAREQAQRKIEADAAELAEQERVKLQELRETKEREAIVQSSYEIRELNRKINASKVEFIRDQQLKHVEQAFERENAQERSIAINAASQRALEERRELQDSIAKRERDLVCKLDLVKQIQERIDLKKAAREEVARERASILESVQRAKKQEEERALMAAQKKKEFISEIEAQSALRRELKERQRKSDLEERKKMEEYICKLREREEKTAKMKAARRNVADERLEELCRQAEEAASQAEEEEVLLDMLRCELESQRAQRALAEEISRRQQQQHELRQAQQCAMKLKAEHRASEKALETEFRQRILQCLADEDKISKMNAVARQHALAAHLREAERCVAFRRRLEEAIKQEEAEYTKRMQEKKAQEMMIVEEEKKRLVVDAADVLSKHMPKGIDAIICLETP